jgi:hypothetical protein
VRPEELGKFVTEVCRSEGSRALDSKRKSSACESSERIQEVYLMVDVTAPSGVTPEARHEIEPTRV